MRVQRQAPAALYPGKDPVPIVQEAGWAPGPVWTGAENLDTTGIRFPDRPASSQSLYRLSYPAHAMVDTSRLLNWSKPKYTNSGYYMFSGIYFLFPPSMMYVGISSGLLRIILELDFSLI